MTLRLWLNTNFQLFSSIKPVLFFCLVLFASSVSAQWQDVSFEDFEDGFVYWQDGGRDVFLRKNTVHRSSGVNSVNIQDDSKVASTTTQLAFDATGFEQLELSFWYKPVSIELDEFFRIQFQLANGKWANIVDYIKGRDFFKNGNEYSALVTINAEDYEFGASSRFRIRSFGNSNADDFFIDDIRVRGYINSNPHLPVPQPLDIDTADRVSIYESQYQFHHWDYALNTNYTLSMVDYAVLTSTTYDTWVIENDYLKVELLPQFGGRILSLFNKKTGHEELFRNPVGTPYLAGQGIFYYDWLMVIGGIFPTFPEPEHGHSWLLPWDFELVQNSDDIVTVRMSFNDTEDKTYRGAPFQYRRGATGMICTMTVSLKAGRSALDVVVTLDNPTNSAKTYEYWTNTAPAPGSDPQNGDNYTFLTEGYEIVADVDELATNCCAAGAPYGIASNAADRLDWDFVKHFVNHETDGIAYPAPDFSHSNFWGAINHDDEEGLFRIADNSLTPGLKIFTFGYENTVDLDPAGLTTNTTNWRRPMVELWAGTSTQFFRDSTIAANSYLHIAETYTPSVGMTTVTHANEDILMNVQSSYIDLYFMTPDQDYRILITENDATLVDEVITPDPINGNRLTGDFSEAVQVFIVDEQNRPVYSMP